MTRLRMPERAVLDTLVEGRGWRAAAARPSPGACAWSAGNQSEWIDNLRTALGAVGRARAEGPDEA